MKLRIVSFLFLTVSFLGCKTSSEQGVLSASVTESLQKKGELLCGNKLPADNKPWIFDLRQCAGKYSYLDVVTKPGGINDVMDADGERPIEVATASEIRNQDAKFAEKVKRRVAGLFKKDGTTQLNRLLEEIKGKRTTTLKMSGVVATALTLGSYELTTVAPQAAVRIAPYVSIASDGGSYILLNDDSHFINVGYATGKNVESDIRKGRSFGVTKQRAALDASDADYLEGLETVLKGGPASLAAYYRALLRMLTATDPSGFKDLSPEAQIVAVDFAAVYTAELDRHLMVKLEPGRYAWEQDLAEATWVSAYVASAGKMFVKGKFTNGRPRDFFAQGTSGGGIGKTVHDRRKLSAAISEYMWKRKDNAVTVKFAKALRAKTGDDLIHKMGAIFVTRDDAAYVLAHADEITTSAVDFLAEIARDAANITKHLETK